LTGLGSGAPVTRPPGSAPAEGPGSGSLAVGLRGTAEMVVGDADTAAALGSGDVPVLGTPRLLALAEAATVAALAPHLDPADTTVGTSVAMAHRRASPVGSVVAVEAELTGVDGRRLTFSFTARGGLPGGSVGQDQVVGTGTIERAVVAREPFLAGLRPPAPPGVPGA
jgi:fluoroacetyl-CoA thioesterase